PALIRRDGLRLGREPFQAGICGMPRRGNGNRLNSRPQSRFSTGTSSGGVKLFNEENLCRIMPEMATTIRFRGNRFAVERDFMFVGANGQCGVVFGGLPPETPLVWVTFNSGGAFLNADISDSDGKLVLQIRDNVITVNKDNIYNLQLLPGNKIPADEVIVT